MLSAFTIVRNAVKLNFPIVATIFSVLGVCDEVVVNVGKSDDETREIVAGIHDSRIRVYGGFDRVATNRRWYRREVRCIRLGRDIHPYQGAQGFRVGPPPECRKIRARLTPAQMFHYGWARPACAINEKLEVNKLMYPWAADRLERERQRGTLEWIPLLRPFTGDHPATARAWIADCTRRPPIPVGPPHVHASHARYYISDWIERLTGARV